MEERQSTAGILTKTVWMEWTKNCKRAIFRRVGRIEGL